MLCRCFEELDDVPGLHRYLYSFLEQNPSTAIALRIVDDLEKQGEGEQATQFLSQQLTRHPTLRGTSRLLELNLVNSVADARDSLTGLQELLSQLMECKPVYRCDDCGFSGRQLHWQCPSCKNWGSVAPIRGLDGD
jgi:lipopolysaccharide biosynthesis regulator YciM